MTKEEIVYKLWKQNELHSEVYRDVALEAMQEYALEYHREKLREELLKFAEWMEGDMRPEYIIQWVDKYLSL